MGNRKAFFLAEESEELITWMAVLTDYLDQFIPDADSTYLFN